MVILDVPDDVTHREWMVAPREGLLTSEIAPVIGQDADSIRAAIREDKLPGVVLQANGLIYAYAARVEDIARFYDLSPATVACLRKLTSMDAPQRIMQLGIPSIHVATGLSCRIEIPYEFDSHQEILRENEQVGPSGRGA